MIIIDDFIVDKKILDHFANKEVWERLDESSYNIYSSVHDKIEQPLADFIWKVKDKFWKYEEWKHFEYWANITDEYQQLDWHVDKNEQLTASTGEVVCPLAGAVWYGYPHKVWGGYLEIENQHKFNVDYERIQPVYNRIVVFDVSQNHRVAPILAGRRYGLQVNLW